MISRSLPCGTHVQIVGCVVSVRWVRDVFTYRRVYSICLLHDSPVLLGTCKLTRCVVSNKPKISIISCMCVHVYSTVGLLKLISTNTHCTCSLSWENNHPPTCGLHMSESDCTHCTRALVESQSMYRVSHFL